MGWMSDVQQKKRAIDLVHAGVPVSEVARCFGKSRQCLHKWLRRHEEEGEAGLEERSRAPHHPGLAAWARAQRARARGEHAAPHLGRGGSGRARTPPTGACTDSKGVQVARADCAERRVGGGLQGRIHGGRTLVPSADADRFLQPLRASHRCTAGPGYAHHPSAHAAGVS